MKIKYKGRSTSYGLEQDKRIYEVISIENDFTRIVDKSMNYL